MSTAPVQVVGESSSDCSASSSSQNQLPQNDQRKRRQVTVACNECRKRKVKCDGLRPACSPCSSRDLTCFYEADPDATPIVALKRKYDQLQQRARDHEEVLEMLRSRPEREALVILARIRASDVSSALAMIKDGDLLIPHQLNLSRLTSPNALPPLNLLTTTERAAKDRNLNQISPPVNRLFPGPLHTFEHQAENSRFDRSQPKPPSSFARGTHELRPAVSGSVDPTNHHQRWSPRYGQTSAFEPNLYDVRLRGVRASQWTSVVIEDSLFAKIISTYLIWDHPPWRLFDEDIFIEELVGGRSIHCSKLLVNAILAYGCQNYAAIEPDREALGVFFFVEAKKLWHLEEGTESLACIAASGLLHGLHSCRGTDKVGFTYLAQGVRMAQDMGLFRRKTAIQVYDSSQPLLSRGRAAVAWGLFSYVVSHSMYMHREPILKTPPPVPIPEPYLSPSLDAVQSSAGIWHGTQTFKAFCQLWVIAKDFLPLYYQLDEPEDIARKGLMGIVVHTYERLLGWVEALPLALRSTDDALPHIINLHMQYHCIVAELFRPFVGEMPESSSSVASNFPTEAAIGSIIQLKHLLHQYVSRYNGPPASISMLGSILCVTYAAIRRLDESEWRFSFAVCIRFLGNMVEYFPVARFVLQAIHNSAERTSTTLPPEALSVFEYYNGSISKVRSSDVASSYPVDLNLSQTDLEGARLSNLIRSTANVRLDNA